MLANIFHDFLQSGDNLQVYERDEVLYSSNKEKLIPWLEYIGMFSPYISKTMAFDKVLGNASALLAIMAGCEEVYSPLGSRLAAITLEKYRIKYHFIHTVPHIRCADSDSMCPLEKLSLGKDPEGFYKSVRHQLLLELRGN